MVKLGVWMRKFKPPSRVDFLYILKVDLKISTLVERLFARLHKIHWNSIFLCLFIFKGIVFITLKLISFFGENYGKSFCIIERLFYNGGMFNLYRSFLKEVLLYNKVSGVGGTGYQMGPLIFFILCAYIAKVYT